MKINNLSASFRPLFYGVFALLTLIIAPSPARADCSAAPLATASDLVISMKTASGIQVAPGNQLASTVKEGMVVYDDANDELKLCDGTNWVSIGSGGGGGGGSAAGGAGYLQFSDGSAGFAYSGTTAGQQLFWDNTNKRLGIGTATPEVSVEAAGGFYSKPAGYNAGNYYAVNSLGNRMMLMGVSSSPLNSTLLQSAGGGIRVRASDGNTNLMLITESGDVAIGLAGAPSYKLHHAGGFRLGASSGSYFWTELGDAEFDFNIASASVKRGVTIHGAAGGGGGEVLSVYGHSGTAYVHGLSVKNNGSVGIGVTNLNASSLVQMDSTTRGFLPPRMTTVQRDAISSPAEGLTIYNTTLHALEFFNGTEWVTTEIAGQNFSNIVRFTTSGSWTVPAGVTKVLIVAFGGGGGGGGNAGGGGGPGYKGGKGGRVVGFSIVTPGANLAYTVGLGGNGTNSDNATGGTGNSTSFQGVTALGGGGGVTYESPGSDGGSTGGVANTPTDQQIAYHIALLSKGDPLQLPALLATKTTLMRSNATSSTAGIAWDPESSYYPGAAGAGETSRSASNATGGIGGALYLIY